MIDAEKLLGKVVEEVIGSGHGMKKLKKKKKKKKKKSSLLSSLSSGAGLMTAIGLGVGAYEILKDKSKQQAYGGTAPHPTAGGGPPPHHNPTAAQADWSSPPPPPPPPGAQQQPPAGSLQTLEPAEVENLAVRMIQVMIAAAHADGTMDAEEEAAVIGRLKGESFSQEEKMFLLGEMHNPQSLDQLTAGITDQAVAKTMYMLAVSTIEIDTPEERQWLDGLSSRLGLSRAVQGFIEEQL